MHKYKRLSKWIIGAVGLITALNLVFIFGLRFNYDFESFFSSNNEEAKYYFDFRDHFENDSDYNLVGIENKKGIFQKDFLLRVDSLVQDFKKVDNVEKIQSITTAKTFIASSRSITPIKLIHLNDFSRLKDDSTNIYSQKELVGTLVSEDATALNIYVKKVNMVSGDGEDSNLPGLMDRLKSNYRALMGDTTNNINKALSVKEKEKKFVLDIEEAIAKYSFDEVHMAGRTKAENYFVNKMQWEIVFFVLSSLVLIVIFLFIAFRSPWGVILPLFVVTLSVIWCMGFISVAGNGIDIMTVLLPTIMFVVGMSDVVHILTKYLNELRSGVPKLDAIKVTIKEVGLATFLTSLTTAIGFLTLLTSGVTPIQNFGLYTAVGVILAFVLSFTFLPAVLLNIDPPKTANKKAYNPFWEKLLHSLFGWILKNKSKVLIASGIVVGVSLWGVSKLEVNAQLIGEVQEGDPLKDDFVFFEKKFAGVRPFEVSLQAGDSCESLLDRRALLEMDKIETFLTEECEIKQVTSPLSLFKIMNRAMHLNDPEEYKFPDEKSYNLVSKYAKKFRKKKEFAMILTRDMKLARLSGIHEDIGSKRFHELRVKFKEFVDTEVNTSIVQPRLTGSALLIDDTNDSLAKNMMIGLGLAFMVIAVIMGLLFQSFRIVLISFIPNVIPLIIIGGILGIFGIGLNISTSIIFTIAFGIAVDDTIHFMSKFKIELMKGRSYLYAIKRTFISTGKAIVVTSIILVSGFLTLMYSDFNGTFYTGLMVSLTLLFAVLADLFLIPVLLISLVNDKQIQKMRSIFFKFKS